MVNALPVPPYEAGYVQQRREYLYKQIIAQFPARQADPILLYGDIEGEFLRLANAGLLPDPAETAQLGRISALETANTTQLTKNGTFISKGDLFFNVKDYGAVGNNVADDTAAIQSAINAAQSIGGGKVLIPRGGVFIATQLFITGGGVSIIGPGQLRDCELFIGAQTGYSPTEIYATVEGVTFVRSVRSSTKSAINVANSIHVDIKNNVFTGYKAGIYVPAVNTGGVNNNQHVARMNISGNRTPIWYDNGNNIAPLDYFIYIEMVTGGATFGVGDILVVNNPDVCVQITHVYSAGGLDGINAGGNYFFFPGYQRALANKQRHFDLQGTTNFVIISNNQLFEAGLESIYLGDSRNITVTGNNVAWPGEAAQANAVTVNIPSGTYCRGIIAGNNFTYYTRSAVEVKGLGDASGLTIGVNATITSNSTSFYYGTPALPTSFARYRSDAGLFGQPRVTDPVSLNGSAQSDNIAGGSTATLMKYADKSVISAHGGKAVTAVATTALQVGYMSDINGSNAQFGGLLIVHIVNAAGSKSANYIVSVSFSANSRGYSTLLSAGDTAGTAADWPSFTLGMTAVGALTITGIGSTAGAFTVYVTTLGNVQFN